MSLPEPLRQALSSRRLVPFAGAGVSKSVRREDGEPFLPDWDELLGRAADKIEQSGKEDDAALIRLQVKKGRYLQAAQDAKENLGLEWMSFLKNELDVSESEIDPTTLALPSALWKLASPLIVTTNYDRILRNACPNQHQLDLLDVEAPVELSRALTGASRRPTLWHLHGRIDNASKIVLAPDGYSALYGSPEVESLYQGSLASLRSLLATHTFLFVGFSLNDPAVGAELKMFADVFQGGGQPHYALVPQKDVAQLEVLNLPIVAIPVESFGEPYLRKIEELAAHLPAKETPPHTGDALEPAWKGEAASFSPSNRVFYVPFAPKGEGVIGRDGTLEQVRKQLVAGRRTSIGQAAAFQGLGGLGKTQMAVEYAHTYGDQYPAGVLWLTADQDLDAQLTQRAEHAQWVSPLSDQQSKLDIARQRLRTFDGGLVVFDNVESLDAIQPYLPAPSVHAHLLLTTRGEVAGFVAVPLGVLSGDDAYALLLSESRRTPGSPEEAAHARAVSDRLAGLPLALELAGAFLLNRKSVSFAEYGALLEQGAKAVLERGKLASFTKHDHDLAAALAVHEPVLEENAALPAVLDVLMWSASSPMSKELLHALLPERSELDVVDALSVGTTLQVLQHTPSGYALHRLVAEVRREQSLADPAWEVETARRLADWFRERRDDFTKLAEYETHLDHLRVWHDRLPPEETALRAELTWLQAYPAYHRGDGKQAHRLVADALETLGDADEELRAHFLHDLSTTLSMQGHYRESLDAAEQALSIRTKILNPDDPEFARSLGSVSASLSSLGRHAESLEKAAAALEIRRRVLGEDHPDFARSLGSVGGALGYLGRHAESLEHKMQALEIRRRVLGEDHPEFAQSLDSLGTTLDNLGRHAESLEKVEAALEIRRRVLGEDHPDFVHSLGSVGVSLNNLGRYAESLEKTKAALEIRRRVLGEDHPEFADSLDSVSASLGNLGRHAESLEKAEAALEIRRRVLGEDHPEFADSLDSVGVTLGNLGRYAKAESYLRQALPIQTRALGAVHPRTLVVLRHLIELAAPGQGGALHAEVRRRMHGLPADDPALKTLRKLERMAQEKMPGFRGYRGR